MIHAIFFLLASTVHAGPCSSDFKKIAAQNKKLYENAKASLPNSKNLDECYRSVQKKLDNCRVQFENGACSDDSTAASAKGTKSLEGAMTSTVKLQVNQANCGFSMAACFRKGGAYDEGESEKITNECLVKNAEKHETAMQDTGTRAQAAEPGGIVQYVLNVSDQISRPQAKCWIKLGEDAEAGARKSLANAGASRANKGSTAAIDCLNQDNGNRLCVYRDSGGTRVKELEADADGKTAIDDASPARLKKMGCSGTLLGDGVTVVSAGHCTNGEIRDGAGDQEIEVFDKTGKSQSAEANCKAGVFGGVGSVDVTTCTLKKPVDSNPVYFATVDDKVSGSRCEDEGYIMRCGEGFFKDLSRKPATQYGYPARVDLKDDSVRENLIRSSGAVHYDESKKTLEYDMLCTGGCSGSGVLVDVNGRRVAVVADSYGSRFTVDNGAPVVPYETMRQLTVQSISRQKLDAGRELFQQMPLEP